MRVELYRFKVRDVAHEKVQEWLDFLRAHPEAVKETLEPERMYVETIFSETRDGVDYLCWFSLQGEDGAPVQASEHWLDAVHLEYWRACIDDTVPPEVLTPEVLMLPDRVRESMRPL